MALGPLVVDSTNPRLFKNSSNGQIVYLTGSQTWPNYQDRGTTDPPPAFDYIAHLDQLVAWGHNFTRLWFGWEQTCWNNNPDGLPRYYSPGPPYERNGPGNANDGKPKFDLTKLSQPHFDRLRARVLAARARGIYVQIMLFDGFTLQTANGFNESGGGFPHQSGNNINSVDVVGGTHEGVAYNTLVDSAVTARQDLLIEKAVVTVNDCDNVLWEVANEPAKSSATVAWENHVISKIHTYEATKTYQHPVIFTSQYPGSDSDLTASAAEGYSPNTRYLENNGSQVVINDTDHSYDRASLLTDLTAAMVWPYKCACLGTQGVFMDPYLEVWNTTPVGGLVRNTPTGTITGGSGTILDPQWAPMRNAMGDARSYAIRLDLRNCIPHTSLSSTGFCVANPGSQYLALQPSTGAFTMTMAAGTYKYEWFDPTNRVVNGTGTVTIVSSGSHTFTPPFSGAAVLLLQSIVGGFGTTFGQNILKLFLSAVAIANLADNAATSPTTNTYASLHTASPSGAVQTTSEATYPSYARVAIPRTTGGWDYAGAVAALHAIATWPASTGTPNEVYTHIGFGTLSSGSGVLEFWGALNPNVTMNASGISPRLATTTTVTFGT